MKYTPLSKIVESAGIREGSYVQALSRFSDDRKNETPRFRRDEMDEKMKDMLLAEVLRKQAFRDKRHRTRPSSMDVVRMMLLANGAGPQYGESSADEAPERVSRPA